MVTVHFYSEESVAAMLLHSLHNNNATDAHNAASELAASDGALLFRVLCLAWWLSPPDHPLQSARATAFMAKDAHGLFSALLGSEVGLPSIQTPVISKPLCGIQKAIKKRNASDKKGIAGRIFTVPEDACAVWNVRLPSVDEIKGDPHTLIQVKMFETEEMEAAFYEMHFPDDIPDEWSDEEIEKSHGRIVTTASRNPWRTAFLDCL